MIKTFIRTTLMLTIFIVPILAFRISYLLAGYALDYLSRFRPIRSLRNAASRTLDYILSLIFIPRVFNVLYGIATRIIRFASSFKSTSLIGGLVSQLWELESSIYLDPSTFVRSLKRFMLSMFSFDTKRLLWTALSMPARIIFFGLAFPLMILRSSFSMCTRMIRYITSFLPLGFLRRLVTESSAQGSIVFFDPSVIKRKLQRLALSLLSISPRRIIWNTLTMPSRAIIFAFVLPLWFLRNAFSIGAMVFGTITSYSTSIDTNGENLVINFKRIPVKEEKKEMKRNIEMNILKDEFMGLMKKSPAIINKKVIITKDDVQILDLKKSELDASVDQRDVEEYNVAHHKREREEKMESGKRDLKKTRNDEHDDVLDEKIKSDWMKQVMYAEPKQQERSLSKQEKQSKNEQEQKLQKQEKENKQKEEEIVNSYSAQIKLLPPHNRREKEDELRQDEKEDKKEDTQMQPPILNEEKHKELKEKIKTEWVKQVMMHAETKQQEEKPKQKEEKRDVNEILDKETKSMTPLTEVRKKRPKPSSSKKKKDKKKESSLITNQEEQAQAPQTQEQLSSKKTEPKSEPVIQSIPELKISELDEKKSEQSQVKQEKPVEKKQKPIISENTKLDLMKEVIEEDPPAPVYDVMMHAESHPVQQQQEQPSTKQEPSNPKQEELPSNKQQQENKPKQKEEEPIRNEVEERGLSYEQIAMKPPTSSDDEQKSDEDQHQEGDKSASPLPVDDQLEERRLHHEIHKIDIVEKISKEDHVMKPKRAHSIHSPSTRRTF